MKNSKKTLAVKIYDQLVMHFNNKDTAQLWEMAQDMAKDKGHPAFRHIDKKL